MDARNGNEKIIIDNLAFALPDEGVSELQASSERSATCESWIFEVLGGWKPSEAHPAVDKRHVHYTTPPSSFSPFIDCETLSSNSKANDPVVSLCGSSIRAEQWPIVYNSVSRSKVPFEMIFVGPNESPYPLPANVRHIRSSTKPAQCHEIAMRHARGKYVCLIADDIVFNANALDMLVEEQEVANREDLIIGLRYFTWNQIEHKTLMEHTDTVRLYPDDHSLILLPGGCFYRRSLFQTLNGFDRRFIGYYMDWDLVLRAISTGCQLVFSKQASMIELWCLGSSVNRSNHFDILDRKLILSLWTTRETMRKERSDPLEPFLNDSIELVTQGEKGKW